MCRYVPTCNVSITISTPDSNQLDLICTWQVSAHVEMPACADMCRHVLICADMCQHVTSLSAPMIPIISTFSAFYYVSAHVDMPICADMCQHVTSLSASLIQIIWTLSPCWHVSALVDMPTCADMCRHMPTCDIIFGPYDTNDLDLICMLTYVSTCGHADMC